MINEKIILTPMQVQALNLELEKTKHDLEEAQNTMSSYKGNLDYKIGENDSVVDDSYYYEIAALVTRVGEIEELLSRHILAEPSGNNIQIGSVVELADRGMKIMIVQEQVTKKSEMTEVSMHSPIFGAIYMHKTGDICEYTVNGKQCKCVIGKVDNDFSNDMANSMLCDSNSMNHGVKVK